MNLKGLGVAGVTGFLLCLGFGAPGLAQDGGAKQDRSFLFVFEGRGGELTPIKGKAGRFEFKMPISGPNKKVTWFTDRPVRDAGHITMGDFIGLWQGDDEGGFRVDPPNVAISFGGKTLIATMTNPRVVGAGVGAGAGSGAGKVLVSTMTLVKGGDLAKATQGSRGLAAHAKRAGSNEHSGVVKVGQVSVFIDVSDQVFDPDMFNQATNQA